MSYKKYYEGGWQSGETGGTPITPEALNHMEQGISDAAPMTYAKKVGTLYNWLDNSYWGNPNEVINQAGVTSAGSWGFLMDRWRANDGGAEVAFWGDGLHFTGSLYQKVADRERFANKPVTIAAKINGKVYCASGTVTYTNEWHRVTSVGGDGADISLVVLGNNELWFQVGNTTNSVGPAFEWAALYEGEYIAETLPEYQPKEYAVDLTECRRYYRPYSTWSSICTGYIDWQGYLTLYIPTDTPMRITPSCGRVQASIIVDGAYINIDETPSSVRQLNGVIYLIFTNTQHSEHVSKPCALSMGDYPIVLSAEL